MDLEAVTSETRFVWLVDGEPKAGTLVQWAHDVEQASYVDPSLVSTDLWLFNLDSGGFEEFTPEPSETWTSDYRWNGRYVVGGAIATVRIDLEA